MPGQFISLVTGASRGLGRGTARGLAAKGAIVYVTARSAESLDEVVLEIEAAGGEGRAIVCDHADDDQVKALFARIAGETGNRLDLLVNNATAVDAMALIAPGGFWEKPLGLADMITVGLRSSYISAYYAALMMTATGRGLIANISFYGAVSYFHGPAYGAAKAGTDKMTADMGIDLAPYGVTAVSYWPGFIMTDAVKAMPVEYIPEDLRAQLPFWELPEFTGFILEALARDPDLQNHNGKAVIGAELGEHYGIVDLDGKRPISYRASLGAPLQFIGIPRM
ncbi:MAG: short-chain dehydrogenase/reductase [Sphingomonadales bacterium]|jgi:NAD(P)-dependent dehydrogenase (short-subunit alcohol dehydrogenase family)|nr:short-chain dehydrogenase/reductase [Sphingomonadales bacterium]